MGIFALSAVASLAFVLAFASLGTYWVSVTHIY
jgi:hypothetical protein